VYEVAAVDVLEEVPPLDERPIIVQPGNLFLAMVIGTEALAAVLPPWCGLGWSPWAIYLACPTIALVILVRFSWTQ